MADKNLVTTKKCLFLCNGGSCMKKGAEEVTQAFRKRIKKHKLPDSYHTVRTRCMGRCDNAPVAMLAPDSIWLKSIAAKQCDSLLQQIQSDRIKDSTNFLHQMC